MGQYDDELGEALRKELASLVAIARGETFQEEFPKVHVSLERVNGGEDIIVKCARDGRFSDFAIVKSHLDMTLAEFSRRWLAPIAAEPSFNQKDLT